MEGKNEGLKSLYMLEVYRVFGFYCTEDNKYDFSSTLPSLSLKREAKTQ
jgi:hypothetical protein